LPSAEAVLELLHTKPVYVGVVSNKRGINLRKEIEHLGWNGYFDSIVGADDAKRDKPHPDPVHLALKESGLVPGPHVWFVGDSEIDLECAQATGMTPLFYGPAEIEEGAKMYGNFPFAHYVRDHDELKALLETIS
jgi:phosphoglycolate phosphatase